MGRKATHVAAAAHATAPSVAASSRLGPIGPVGTGHHHGGSSAGSRPSLEALVEDPSRLAALESDVLIDIYRSAAFLKAAVHAQLLVHRHAVMDHPAMAINVEILSVREAAAFLGMKEHTLYRKWPQLPGAFKDKLDGHVKFFGPP